MRGVLQGPFRERGTWKEKKDYSMFFHHSLRRVSKNPPKLGEKTGEEDCCGGKKKRWENNIRGVVPAPWRELMKGGRGKRRH